MIKAIIFDLNGVMINDEKYCQEAWKIYGLRHNLTFTEKDFRDHMTGSTHRDIFKYIYKRDLPEKEFEEKTNEYLDIVIDLFKNHLKPTDGLLGFLELLKENNFVLAVASSAHPRYFNFIMDNLNLRNYFTIVLNSTDIKKGKPNPEIYLKTASLLNVSPEDCLIFEDAIIGIKAAKAAGMKVIAISSTFKKSELGEADRIIDNFEGLTLSDINI